MKTNDGETQCPGTPDGEFQEIVQDNTKPRSMSFGYQSDNLSAPDSQLQETYLLPTSTRAFCGKIGKTFILQNGKGSPPLTVLRISVHYHHPIVTHTPALKRIHNLTEVSTRMTEV